MYFMFRKEYNKMKDSYIQTILLGYKYRIPLTLFDISVSGDM